MREHSQKPKGHMKTDDLLKRTTPRNWKIDRCESWRLLIGTDEISICIMADGEIEDEKADAELIIRAVNSFEAMREALKELLKHAEWSGTPRGYEAKDFEPMFERAESALALAEGKAVQS
jgi:predicted signal transduction protein with EAL and GGDEF domain